MTAAFPLPKSKKAEVKAGVDRALLLEHLRSISKRAMVGEAERRALARRGAKLAKGKMWEEGITSGRLPITANQSISLGEQFISEVIRGLPIPEIKPINGADEDAAALLEGGILTNMRVNKMISHLKSSMRVAFFSLPNLQYTYWDPEARDGIGDYKTRMVPAHQCIIDNRHWFTKDMEFVGIRETMTRARLARLFPDKLKEIEGAANADSTEKPGMPEDPWQSPFHQGRPNSLSRLVANNQGQFTGKTSIKVGGTRRSDHPLAEEVQAEFIWFKDNTPETVLRPKLDCYGRPIYRHARHPDTGELLFEHSGWEVQTDPELGTMYKASLKPKREPVMEEHVVRKYPRWRHVAFLPGDDIVLWDVNWQGPCPLWSVRTSYPLNEYWQEGQGLRLASLAIARNILWTIIFQRLKLSLGGTWLASHRSGLKRQKLTPEDGQVFYGKDIGQDQVRQFPVTPLDVSYLNVLGAIEQEMMKLVGIAAVQRGQAAGRIDTGAAYDKLVEQAGTAVVDCAQLLEESLRDYAEIAIWYMQNFYTHEHYVEVEAEDGLTSWRQASRVAVQGEFSVNIDTGAMVAHSESAMRELAKEGASLGIYTLPMLAKMGRYPQWRRALKQKMVLANDPTKAPLMGPAGAPPGKTGGQPAKGNERSHHAQPKQLAHA